MLYTESAVRANLRNRDGKRVFFLASGDQLTPGAKDFLRENRIEILPASQARPASYHALDGGEFTEKPEHMTHLRDGVLVAKNHPRIVFRGMVDWLEAELILAQRDALEAGQSETCRELADALSLARQIIRCDVLDEPLGAITLGGLDEAQLRERSHKPQNYYQTPHFMPEHTQSRALLSVNRARTVARQAELACYEAFRDREGRCLREDLLRAMNRLSSFLWILEIKLADKGE